MNDFILFLHFIGLAIMAAGGVATGTIMRRAGTMPPEQAAPLRSLGPALVNMTATGVAILWITGLILVWSKWSGFQNLPPLFWVKFVFVVIVTLLTAAILLTYAKIRRTRDPSLARRLPVIGPLNGLAALLAVLFAAYAFH
jgi:hypothetical protein